MKKVAIIVAGGSGQRMGSAIPKQFLSLNRKPLLAYTITTFLNAYSDLQVILVLPREHVARGEELIKESLDASRIKVVTGGETRFHSVKNGLQLIKDPSIVFVHDGVRCLVSMQLIQNCYNQAVQLGSAIPAVAATDSIRIADEHGHQIIDRNKVRIIQTPQTFQSHLLLQAFEQHYSDAFTDEASVVEAAGQKVHLIEGEHRNIKITRQIDLYIAEKLLDEL
jgi:2-C-methyl-D-erythritol 4-phosphate cytidylyltransferase